MSERTGEGHMVRRVVRASVLWGIVGSLLFVVLAVGYRLATGTVVGVPTLLAVAALVGVVVALLSYGVETRLA